jgi:hypothetical protein
MYFANRHNGKCSQVGSDYQWLGVMVADNANAFGAMQFWKVRFKFGSKIIILNVVDFLRQDHLVSFRDGNGNRSRKINQSNNLP